jgi:microcystin-dependent protein
MHRIKSSQIVFLMILTLSLLSAAPYSYSGVPQLINYQGKLTSAGGSSVPDGSYDVEFKIYDVATGGTALWSETWNSGTSQVATKGGVFNALLGKYNTIPVTFFADHSVTYLGITVGSDSEMTPRQRITSVGYAFEAANGVPKGFIGMWSGSVSDIPVGWALCDGTNGTPDLRDRFVLGSGSTYPVGSMGGSTTKNLSHTHTGPPHTHTYSGTTSGNSAHDNFDGGGHYGAEDPHTHTYSGTTDVSGTGNTGSGGSITQDIMPPYYALAFIMKL